MIAGINEILVEDAQIQSLVGNNAAGTKVKVYPVVAPAGEEPEYITTSLAGFNPTQTKTEANNLDYPSAAINVHAKSYDRAVEISERVKAIFDTNGFQTDAGYEFLRTWIVNEFDRPEMFTADYPVYVRTVQVGTQLRRS
jgi:hypothetical protein